MRAFLLTLILLQALVDSGQAQRKRTMNNRIRTVLEHTAPLAGSRSSRLPLYVWALNSPGTEDEGEIEAILKALDDRGIALYPSWNHRRFEESLAEGLRVARIQKRLGLPVSVNANDLLHRFADGSPQTAHVTDDGDPFFDASFGKNISLGCPFALEHRVPEIRGRVESFAQAYCDAGLEVDVAFADWEIDGPIEWNDAWENSKKCHRCKEHIPDIDDFGAFQDALRTIRSDLQREAYAGVLTDHFPGIRVGNYAVYPHNGERYWYDYFEKLPDGVPFRTDQRARYRPWAHEFPLTGFTLALPVVYTWYPTYTWYDFTDPDYRWFYNLLLVASNAAEHTPRETPLAAFVHWHTTSAPSAPDPDVRQFSAEAYQDLLWHMLLRGTDTFILWCPLPELAEEVRLVHEVYAAAQAYGDFLRGGTPVTFEVPPAAGPVLSALRLGDRLLVRRTDFGKSSEPVSMAVDGRSVTVPPGSAECWILSLD